MNAAAIQGTYADYRRVKGRKVLQLVIEVPIEQAPQVHEAFGEPSPDGSTWVAVALLDVSKAQEKPKDNPHKLSQQAAMLCEDARFQSFLRNRFQKHTEQYFMHYGISSPTQGMAAAAVRYWCIVSSRSELDTNPEAAARWRNLKAEYEAWLRT